MVDHAFGKASGLVSPLYEASEVLLVRVFFFQAEDGMRDLTVTGVQTCALPIYHGDDRCLPGDWLERPLLPRTTAVAWVQANPRGDTDRPRDPGGNGQGDSHERAAAGRRGVRHRLRLSGCTARTCARALPAFGGAHA